MKNKKMKRAAMVMALILAGGTVLGSAGMPLTAEAGSVIGSTQTTGSLTIHKTGFQPDEPLAGAQFSLYRVMELKPGTKPGERASYETVQAFSAVLGDVGQDELKNYSASEMEELLTELAVTASGIPADRVGETGASGDAVFGDLPLGFYLVTETAAPAGYMTGNPFLIAIPSTDNYAQASAQGTEWVYDVSANPKNTQVRKELAAPETGAEQDGTAGVGDYIKYVVKAAIPNYPDDYFTAAGNQVTFIIADEMSPGLSIQNEEAHPVTVMAGENGKVAAGSSTYMLTAAPVETAGIPDLKIVFSKTYIQANRGRELELTYYAKVTEQAVTGTAGNTNTATITYNNSPTTTVNTVPPEVRVYSFRIRVEKFSETAGIPLPLENAEFELYEGADFTEAVRVGTTAFKTDSKGILSSPQLDEGTYWLKETKSPAGYTLLANPVKVVIAANRSEGEADGTFALSVDDAAISTDVKDSYRTRQDAPSGTAIVAVENHRGFNLPATGGRGAALLLIGGAAGIAVLFAAITRKAKNE